MGKPKRCRYDGAIGPGSVVFRLTIVDRAPSKTNKGRWIANCVCGTTRTVAEHELRSGVVRSCGCWARERLTQHGHARKRANGGHSPTYESWCHMIGRCENETDKRYPRYGGRGIAVCERWHVFENFLSDMGEKPPHTTIDRIDNDGNYEPSNCRWATAGQQTRNRSISKVSALGGILLRQMWLRAREYGRKKQIAEWFGISYEHAHKVGTGRAHADAIDEISRADDTWCADTPAWASVLGTNLRWGAALCRAYDLGENPRDLGPGKHIPLSSGVAWIPDGVWRPGCGKAAP